MSDTHFGKVHHAGPAAELLANESVKRLFLGQVAEKDEVLLASSSLHG